MKTKKENKTGLDLFWTTNEDRYVKLGCFATIRDDAPPKAKASYERCMRQFASKGKSKQPTEE
ncbi:MAG: hypothetical protein IJJ41_03800 [Clostridia bacterium]|nr:hypothetical protein [Clostridia bacterium]